MSFFVGAGAGSGGASSSEGGRRGSLVGLRSMSMSASNVGSRGSSLRGGLGASDVGSGSAIVGVGVWPVLNSGARDTRGEGVNLLGGEL